MEFSDRVIRKYKQDGLLSVLQASVPFLEQKSKLSLYNFPYNISIQDTYDIYEKEWDLLVVLDACRYDIMEQITPNYSFIDSLGYEYSPASSSKQWLQHQFRSKYEQEMSETAHVTGNPFSDEVLNQSDFAILDEVWKYGWSGEIGTVPPRVITDRAITVSRNDNPDRMLVHYMQPHFPVLENPELGGKVDPEENAWINSVWSQLKNDELSYQTVWDAYKSNLESVMEEVRVLLDNSEFERVIITADHGNGFGERGIYGHPANRIHPSLRKVPWISTTANDHGNHTPENYDQNMESISLDDRLGALGYI